MRNHLNVHHKAHFVQVVAREGTTRIRLVLIGAAEDEGDGRGGDGGRRHTTTIQRAAQRHQYSRATRGIREKDGERHGCR